jgi:LytS/YehU family sensor histidine kinase
MIYEDKEVILSKEIKFIEEYIELQTMRNQLKITCHFEKEIKNENVQIAPAIFLPYIENAFKYCDLSKEKNIVSIALIQKGDLIFFSVQNPIFQEVSSYKQGGKGLDIAKKRLQMCYPNCFSVSIQKQDNLFSVEIKIWIK